MTRQPVESSNLVSVGYDEATQILEVEFQPNKTGASSIWQYRPVSRETFEQIIDPANSAGAVFHAAVRSNKSLYGEQVGFSMPGEVPA
jgi:hypothetical protein